MAHVLAFANQKGGVAKTTSTLNLGVALTELGKRVLAVDMDPQGNLTMSQGIDPEDLEKSMFDVLVHRLPIEDVIVHSELDVATSTIDLAGAEIELVPGLSHGLAIGSIDKKEPAFKIEFDDEILLVLHQVPVDSISIVHSRPRIPVP